MWRMAGPPAARAARLRDTPPAGIEIMTFRSREVVVINYFV